VIAFGEKMASIIANTAEEALHIFTNTIVPAAYHVFEAITDAVLHPKEFFTNIANDVAQFFQDPVGSIKSAITEIAKVGGEVLDAAKMVIHKLTEVASRVEAALASTLIDIANKIAEAFSTVGRDIASTYHAVKRFFESIF
jgi:phage-related protein